MILNMDKSHCCRPGPRTILRPALPKPKKSDAGALVGGSWNEQVLKNVPATQGWPFGFCPGTRSARCPPSELAKLPLPSVIVYQFPVERVVIPAICQPPRILSAAPFRPPPKCLPCPMGKL